MFERVVKTRRKPKTALSKSRPELKSVINKKKVFHAARRRAFLLPENWPFKLNVEIATSVRQPKAGRCVSACVAFALLVGSFAN